MEGKTLLIVTDIGHFPIIRCSLSLRIAVTTDLEDPCIEIRREKAWKKP
ncbi:MAG: hypothetical protein IKZ82_09725 [Clostridia bacterium]|nr:hypothetical protein [Clostridia bacterium]